MTVSIKHKFTNVHPDGDDTTLVRPSNWNDEHDLILSTTGLVIGRKSAGGGAAEELTSADLVALIGSSTWQPLDSDLTAIAAIAPSNDDIIQRKAGAWINRTLAQLMTDLAALGTTFQPLAASLTSWASVTRASGFDTFVATPSSANLRALLTDEVGTGAAYFVGGALGTPASGAATNLTGTASGLTAGNVTTNANLTGAITSVGNATSVASQTGTGSKFVMDASPTLTGTPQAPTAAVDTSTTQIATTAMVLAQAAAAIPLVMAPTAVVGTSTRFARADHVHPSTSGVTVQSFTASGTWTKPAGCVKIKATIIGAGGAGGGAPGGANTSAGGGGGAGATAITFLSVTGISTLTVTVGSGGTGVSGAAGNSGGTSGLGTANANGQATGGGGGFADTNGSATALAAGGTGGAASSGTFNFSGAIGNIGLRTSGSSGGGSGAPSTVGGGGAGTAGGAAANGSAGNAPGSGGGGAATGTGSSFTGGAGADGIVIIEEYYA